MSNQYFLLKSLKRLLLSLKIRLLFQLTKWEILEVEVIQGVAEVLTLVIQVTLVTQVTLVIQVTTSTEVTKIITKMVGAEINPNPNPKDKEYPPGLILQFTLWLTELTFKFLKMGPI